LHASEQDRDDVQLLRQAWHKQFEGIDLDCLVFIDESGAQTNMCRRHGRSRIGERLVARVPHGHWKTSTIISAVGLRGAFAPAVFDSPADGEVFRAYVQQMLCPKLRQGDIVILDNLQSHKAAGVSEAVRAVGASVLYLPPYSPDFNPIENMWSKVKTHLRTVAARTFDTLCDAVAEGLEMITLNDCRGFFQNCGYATQ
jgi:transposase